MNLSKRALLDLAYGLTVLVVVLPFIKWANNLSWQFNNLSALTIFPLLGLWAFGLMWTHFVISVPKAYADDDAKQAISHWYRSTSNAVLVLILLHPLLLLIGIRGINALKYVAPENHLYVFLAYFALTSFLLWEVVEYLKNKPFVKNRKALWGAINNAAFVAIYIHSIFLGGDLQTNSWFRWYWYVLGATTVIAIGHIYFYELKSPQETTKSS